MNSSKPFLWGVATSSYQIEGAVKEGGRTPSIWDTFSHTPGVIADGTNGDIACDHYHKFKEDVDLIKDLNVDAYRFSISWSRVIPEGIGAINKDGIDFYNRLVDNLLEKGLQPWVTLYHWDLPQVLQDRGGWTNPDAHKWFKDYATTTASALSDRVKHFFLLNEPSVACFEGHVTGSNAPGIKNKEAHLKASHQQNLSIKHGYQALKSIDSNLQVGSAFTYFPVRPAKDEPAYHTACAMMDALWNRIYLDALLKGSYPEILAEDMAKYGNSSEDTKTQLDFVGLQHYSPSYAHPNDTNDYGASFGPAPGNSEVTDMGWAIDPAAFHECLVEFKKTYGDIPVYVSENGCAMADTLGEDGKVDDPRRVEYFKNYVAEVERAQRDGANIKGYFVWSLLDNFEWAFGLAKRFGIVYVDFKNGQKRIPKSSYYWWQDRLARSKNRDAA